MGAATWINARKSSHLNVRGRTMSSSYTFTDLSTGNSRFFYGYLYDCRIDTSPDCPYRLQLNDGKYCNHPNSREYGCGSLRKRANKD
jgi:hypothetical protein